MNRRGLFAAAALLLVLPRIALAFSVEVGGLAKATVRGIRYDSESVRASLDSSDDLESGAGFRLTSQTQVTDGLTFDLDYELIRLGGDVTTRHSELAGDADRFRLFDFTSDVSESSSHVTTHRLDRFSLNWELREADIRVGRQAVTWGGGLLFNPMDLVNPFSPTDTLRDYKEGDDLVSLRYTHETGPEIQAIGRPGRDAESGDVTSAASTCAAKIHGVSGVLEGELLVALQREHAMTGMGVSGYAGEAAFRCDLVVSEENGGTLSSVANMDLSWVAWKKNWYGFVELYHNGFGTTDYAEAITDPVTLDRLARGEVFTLGKNYVATRIQMEAHPLVNLGLTAITNVDDPSGVLQPTLIWDARENFRMDVGALIPWGAGNTEFGGFSLPGGNKVVPAHEVILRGTWFF